MSNTDIKLYNYVGSGTYGCVVVTVKKKFVLKLFNDETDWKEEIEQHNIIQKIIDPKNHFSIRMISKKIIKDNKGFLKKINNFHKCDLIDARTPAIYEIKYQYGGIDLDDYIKKYDLSELDFYIFFKNFLNIIEGVKTINEYGYSHFDIKNNNILYNPDLKKFTLIDFGLFDKYEYFFNQDNNYSHIYYPSEFYFIQSIYKKKDIDIHKINLYTYYKEIFVYKYEKSISIHRYNLKFLSIYTQLTKIKQKILSDLNEPTLISLIDLFRNNNEFIKGNINEYFISICENKIDIRAKIDVYLLGLTLLTIILAIFSHIRYNETIYNIPSELFDLIIKMIDINPCSRITIQEALKEYQRIFSK
jgi:serine/threonine protein kinase